MLESGEVDNGWRNLAGDGIVGKIQNSEFLQVSNVRRNLAGEAVTDEVEDTEQGEGGNAGGNLARNCLPISEGEGSEAVEFTNLRRD